MLKYFNHSNILKKILLFVFVLSIGLFSNLSDFIIPVMPVSAEDDYTKIGDNELRGV